MGFPSGNRLLDALPEPVRERLGQHARVITLERGQGTIPAGAVMRTVDFPLTALMSIMGMLENGATVEVASIGTEAWVEVDAVLNAEVALRTASCQFPGDVVRIPIEDFKRELELSAEFGRLTRRAARARLFVTEQSVMCNLRHGIVERLARWLLVTRERLRRDDFAITHEFLAMILGSRRAGVSEAAAELQARGAIEYQRGFVGIADVDQLVAASCECYALCRDAIEAALTESEGG